MLMFIVLGVRGRKLISNSVALYVMKNVLFINVVFDKSISNYKDLK